MTDIVERLRALEAWIRKPEGEQFTLNTDLFDDAADEIERLRGGMLKMASAMSKQIETIERLREALRMAEIGMSEMGMRSNARYKEVCAALEGT